MVCEEEREREIESSSTLMLFFNLFVCFSFLMPIQYLFFSPLYFTSTLVDGESERLSSVLWNYLSRTAVVSTGTAKEYTRTDPSRGVLVFFLFEREQGSNASGKRIRYLFFCFADTRKARCICLGVAETGQRPWFWRGRCCCLPTQHQWKRR